LGFTFAPRIKNLAKQSRSSFPQRRRKAYEHQGFRILPDGYIDTHLIAEHWEDILRFVATIKLKETTASQLFKRLNSYSKQHPLWQALKEFGKVIKTRFILGYLDDVAFRQAIEKQLNKGESSNKFSRAISFGNNQEFLYGEKVEQEIAESCRRLIKNAIVCWNYVFLSHKIAQESNEQHRQALIDAVRAGSVVTWHHINLHGEYDFSDEKLQDSVGLHLPTKLAREPI
jgi:TnpA family transposase